MNKKNDDQNKAHDLKDDLDIEILDINNAVSGKQAKERTRKEKAQFDKTTFSIVTYSAIIVVLLLELIIGISLLKMGAAVLIPTCIISGMIGFLIAELKMPIVFVVGACEIIVGMITSNTKATVMGCIILVFTALMRKIQIKKDI